MWKIKFDFASNMFDGTSRQDEYGWTGKIKFMNDRSTKRLITFKINIIDNRTVYMQKNNDWFYKQYILQQKQARCTQMKWEHLMFERQVKLIIFKSLTSTELLTNKKITLTLQTTCFIALAGLIYAWTVCTELLATKSRTKGTNDNLSNDFFSLRFYFRDVTLNIPGELCIASF